MEDDPGKRKKHLEEAARLIREQLKADEDIALYNRVRGSPLYPTARWVRLHRRRLGISAAFAALGASAALVLFPTGENSLNIVNTPPAPTSSEPFAQTASSSPATLTAETSRQTPISSLVSSEAATQHTSTGASSEIPAATANTPLSSETPLDTGVRDPSATIGIRNGFSLSKTTYVCEDLVFSAYQERRMCSEQEQQLFNNSRSQLEAFSNSVEVFSAFPPGYQPFDRSAMGFAACSNYARGATASEVAILLAGWYPVHSFNADVLARLSLKRICPQ